MKNATWRTGVAQGCADTVAQFAWPTVALGAGELDRLEAVQIMVSPVAVQALARRTDTVREIRSGSEVLGSK